MARIVNNRQCTNDSEQVPAVSVLDRSGGNNPRFYLGLISFTNNILNPTVYQRCTAGQPVGGPRAVTRQSGS